MNRRRLLAGFLALVLALGAGSLVSAGPLAAEDGSTCPRCGAPRRPGAAFCGKCGYRFTGPPPPAAAAPEGPEVVQVVVARDAELTSTFESIAHESGVRVASLLGVAFSIAPGEFVTDSGLLVGAKEVSLRTPSGRLVPARVVGADDLAGVALLSADVPGAQVLPLRTTPEARVGEPLTVLGVRSETPESTETVTTAGVVSATHRGGAHVHPIEDYLQSDASLPHGFAGGPWLDAKRQVFGMATGFVLASRVFLGPQSGMGYAVPADSIARSLAWIRAGSPVRAWIGACPVPADADLRERYKLPPQVPLVIDSIFPGSPAAAPGGLRRGDGLLEVDGATLTTLAHLQTALLDRKPGESVRLLVQRDGGTAEVTLTLVPRPDRARLAGLDALRLFGGLEFSPEEGGRLVVDLVASGSHAAAEHVSIHDVLLSVLSKKDWLHGSKDNSRWRSVHDREDLETYLKTSYSDLDFCVGLRFRTRDGSKREMLIWEVLSPPSAL